MRIHALLFLLFTQSAFALYGGRPVPQQKHVVELSVSGKVFCKGTVIARNKVLTTGHCIQGMGQRLRETTMLLAYHPEMVSVNLGKEKVTASMISFAPSYFDSPGLAAEDLALIDLAAPLQAAEVLPLATRNDLLSGAEYILTTGKEEASTRLRQKLAGPDSLVLITDGSRAGVCQGDSGGALLLVKNGKRVIAGILSAQREGCAKAHSVSYFPRTRF